MSRYMYETRLQYCFVLLMKAADFFFSAISLGKLNTGLASCVRLQFFMNNLNRPEEERTNANSR